MRALRCHECEREATFTSPRLLCDEHWAEWWVELYPKGKMREKAKKETLKLLTAALGCQRGSR